MKVPKNVVYLYQGVGYSALLQGYANVNKRKTKTQIGTTVVRPLTSSLGFNL